MSKLTCLILCLFGLLAFAEDPDQVLEQVMQEKASEGWTFDVGYNWTLNHPLTRITGHKNPKNWEKKVVFQPLKLAGTEVLPLIWDWRDNLQEHTPPVKNQGTCAGSWAFASIASMEYAYAIAKSRVLQFSEQELISCSGAGDCSGGFFGHRYLMSPGIALSTDFPYEGSNYWCRPGTKQEEFIKKVVFIGEEGRTPTVDEIKLAVWKHGAVAATVAVNSAMSAYKGGIFDGCSRGSTNHVVNIIGWGYATKSRNRAQNGAYWIVRNSWGRSWGEDGHIKIPFNCSHIGEQVSYVVY